MLNILCVGDVFSKPGRKLIFNELSSLQKENHIDFTIINVENTSGGNGLSVKHAHELFALENTVFTSGNHIFDKGELNNLLQEEPRLLRPANYPGDCVGRGYGVYRLGGVRIGVINLSGTTFMPALDNPFYAFDKIYEILKNTADIIVVDFHAEATSEKIAFGYHVDGRASAVFGTHTHVQTADARVLSAGTGYITDVGMTGPLDGVIGVDKDIILKKFTTLRPVRFSAAKGASQLNAVVFSFGDDRRCTQAKPIYKVFH